MTSANMIALLFSTGAMVLNFFLLGMTIHRARKQRIFRPWIWIKRPKIMRASVRSLDSEEKYMEKTRALFVRGLANDEEMGAPAIQSWIDVHGLFLASTFRAYKTCRWWKGNVIVRGDPAAEMLRVLDGLLDMDEQQIVAFDTIHEEAVRYNISGSETYARMVGYMRARLMLEAETTPKKSP